MWEACLWQNETIISVESSVDAVGMKLDTVRCKIKGFGVVKNLILVNLSNTIVFLFENYCN